MATKQRSNRYVKVSPSDDGDILDLGPASNGATVGVFGIQFIPSQDFVGQFGVLGRALGQAAKEANAPFIPFPYRRVNVAGVASDRTIVSDVISASGAIEVGSNGWSIGLLVACSAGTCAIIVMDLNGPGTE